WEMARSKGYQKYFSDEETPGVIDDHYFINEALPIPTINIINKPPGRRFGKHWHTHKDNMDNISKETLEAVTNVVTRVLFYESTNQF
ncbi:MAG: M28 family peptidase, partial [Saprospiraceae bacterium]